MNQQNRQVPSSANRGFTLLELLVAMIVMTMILTLLLSVSTGIMKNSSLCNRTLDATAQARAVLDAMESDLANLVSMRGLTIYGSQTASSSANPELAFLTQGRGPSTASRLMGVCYQLSSDGTIQRFSNPALWDHDDLETRILGALSSGTFSAVGKGILRFSACAVLDNGAMVAFTDSTSGSSWKTTVNNSAAPSFFGMNFTNANARRVRGLVVGVVAVDEQTYRQLQKSGKLDQAIAAFPAPSMSGTSVVNTPDDWAASLSNRNNENLNALPPSTLAAMQVFQNTYFFH